MRYIGTVENIREALLLVDRKFLVTQQSLQCFHLLKVGRHIRGNDHLNDESSKFSVKIRKTIKMGEMTWL